MEFYNQDNLNISKVVYESFLNNLKDKLKDSNFEKSLHETQEIDKKYYAENITVEELLGIVDEYSNKELSNVDNVNKIQIIFPGNPEFVFRLGIEAVRQSARMIINIDDFCLAQNMLIMKILNSVAEEFKLGEILKIQNLVKDIEIAKISEKCDMTICFGNTNDYNRLNKLDKVENLKLYPFNVFEIYSDSIELEDVRRGLFDYISRNQFDVEIYDIDLEIEDVIEEMNTYGYGFCSILLSKDKEKIKKFKEGIKAKYIFVNENPFSKIKFVFDIKDI